LRWPTTSRYVLLFDTYCSNVEVCAHIRSFKYVYKYTFKSPDHTAITVDEIQAHLSGRLLSVSEAIHRLLALPLHKEWPPVIRLDIHLPRQQSIVFDPTEDEDALLQQLEVTVSTLMGWFALNAADELARTLCYHEAPEWFTWSKGMWHRRSNRKMAVGRIYGIAPQNVELHSLRRLLSVVKGATSFADLATVVCMSQLAHVAAVHNCRQDGHVHGSFRSALYARGMAHDDGHLVATMMEIVAVEVSIDRIRRLFARMLVHSAPQDAQALFNQFAGDLCDGDTSDAAVVRDALGAIEVFMLEMGRSLTHEDYGFNVEDLPAALDGAAGRNVRRRVGHTADSILNATLERDRLVPLLTAEQRSGYDMVMSLIASERTSKVVAVLSSAGCGKTVFANAVASTVRARGSVAICVAASALAAMLLLGGTTAHSRFHIPIPANDGTTCCLSADDRNLLRSAQVILYDECSMVHEDVADTLERSLRDLMHDPRPFGGKVVIFMGDFKQLLPVVRYGRGHEHTMQRCSWWRGVIFLKFTMNWRAIRNPDFAAMLESIGSGDIADVIVPVSSRVDDIEALITEVYGDQTKLMQHQILALTLETCKTVNAACLSRWPGLLLEKFATDNYVDCRDPDGFPHEYIESLQIHGAPPFSLGLKIGAKYMCIRNIDVSRGLANGTMLQLLSVSQRFLQCRITSGTHIGAVEMFIPCVFSITPESSGLPFTLERRQYPIIPASCLSVHKAQGQSLEFVGLVFETDPFAHGQLYVALSRAGSWGSIRVVMRSSVLSLKNLVFQHLLV
jgi:ATP-dependent DNA helicase PIF1